MPTDDAKSEQSRDAPRHLTADTITKIDAAIEDVVQRAGFGSVTLIIDRGKLKWIQPAPSVPVN